MQHDKQLEKLCNPMENIFPLLLVTFSCIGKHTSPLCQLPHRQTDKLNAKLPAVFSTAPPAVVSPAPPGACAWPEHAT